MKGNNGPIASMIGEKGLRHEAPFVNRPPHMLNFVLFSEYPINTPSPILTKDGTPV
jgi:hypothetical protein